MATMAEQIAEEDARRKATPWKPTQRRAVPPHKAFYGNR